MKISRPALYKLAIVCALSLPVIAYVFRFSILQRNGIFHGEDWDYFAQNYEAARLSILEYRQFPWWNPWSVGGQPLFANPQFGLLSIQMPLVLLFGTNAGLHLSIVFYFLLGFWGMYHLVQRIGSTSKLISALLAYIWVFSGFSAWHLGGGHLTFALYLLTPLAVLTILNIRKRLGWLWLGLTISLLLNSGAHYLSFEIIILVALIALFQLWRDLHRNTKKLKSLRALLPILRPYLYALVIVLVLCSARIYYTLQFLHEYPRFQTLDPPVSVKIVLAALTFRQSVDPGALTTFTDTRYTWPEFGNYIGITTLVLFCYLLVKKLDRLKSLSRKEFFILIALALSSLMTLGAYSSLSPFAIAHHLPVFNQMRVPSRFICWIGFFVILFLARLPKRPIVYILLFVAAVDTFAANYGIINYPQKRYVAPTNYGRVIEQHEFYDTSPELGQMGVLSLGNYRLLRATQQNYGEIYGYEPVLNIGEFYYLPGTTRCGVEKGCSFVMSNNAKVVRWTPQHIQLERTGSGLIKINMNPGKVWQINGKKPFDTYRVLELQKDFIITDTSKTINVTYHPELR